MARKGTERAGMGPGNVKNHAATAVRGGGGTPGQSFPVSAPKATAPQRFPSAPLAPPSACEEPCLSHPADCHSALSRPFYCNEYQFPSISLCVTPPCASLEAWAEAALASVRISGPVLAAGWLAASLLPLGPTCFLVPRYLRPIAMRYLHSAAPPADTKGWGL